MAHANRWSALELKALDDNPHLSAAEMTLILPGRSAAAIADQRRNIGKGPGHRFVASRCNGWRPEEDAVILAHPWSTPAHDLLHKLPGRTVDAISTRRRVLRGTLDKNHGKDHAREKALKSAGEQAKKRAEMDRPPPVQPPQPGEITHREIDGRKIAVLWGDDGVPMVMPACWEPSRDGMFSALYRRNQSSLAVVPLALPAAQLGGPVAS